jgi:phosphopantothenoylcysteine decarboxylase/phosphopantothenate--cysteine ligase
VLLAPAMNTNMWEHPAVAANLATLSGRGVRFVDPGDGYLACGWVGAGRLAEPEVIAAVADAWLSGERRSLEGRRVLVTAGPTVEDLDAVRFIGNRSSGRMGFALAEQAVARGAEVTLVAGPTSVEPPAGATIVRVRSAQQMHAAVMAHAFEADIVIMAAAVADYTPAGGTLDGKIEKSGALTLQLERTADILLDLGRTRGDSRRPLLVGFAAQAGDPVPQARRKLDIKNADLIVANDVTAPGAGFDVDTNQVTIVARDAADESLPLMTKREVARRVLDRIEVLLASPASRPVPQP